MCVCVCVCEREREREREQREGDTLCGPGIIYDFKTSNSIESIDL